jgi:hypothetical protein
MHLRNAGRHADNLCAGLGQVQKREGGFVDFSPVVNAASGQNNTDFCHVFASFQLSKRK